MWGPELFTLTVVLSGVPFFTRIELVKLSKEVIGGLTNSGSFRDKEKGVSPLRNMETYSFLSPSRDSLAKAKTGYGFRTCNEYFTFSHFSGFLKFFNPFTPESDQFQISPAASPCDTTQYMKNLAFHRLLR